MQIKMIRENSIGVEKYVNSVPSIVTKHETFDWKHSDTEVCDVIVSVKNINQNVTKLATKQYRTELSNFSTFLNVSQNFSRHMQKV